MSAADPTGEGLELPLRRTSHVAGAAAKHQLQRPGRRRTTLAELGERLETHSEPVTLWLNEYTLHFMGDDHLL